MSSVPPSTILGIASVFARRALVRTSSLRSLPTSHPLLAAGGWLLLISGRTPRSAPLVALSPSLASAFGVTRSASWRTGVNFSRRLSSCRRNRSRLRCNRRRLVRRCLLLGSSLGPRTLRNRSAVRPPPHRWRRGGSTFFLFDHCWRCDSSRLLLFQFAFISTRFITSSPSASMSPGCFCVLAI